MGCYTAFMLSEYTQEDYKIQRKSKHNIIATDIINNYNANFELKF